MYIEFELLSRRGRMPYIALPSRAPEDQHRDSANRNSVRGGGRHDYHDIPAPVTASPRSTKAPFAAPIPSASVARTSASSAGTLRKTGRTSVPVRADLNNAAGG